MELKEWRAKRDMTQAELAERLSVSVWTVAQWERGRRKVPAWLPLALDGITYRDPWSDGL